MAGGADKNRLRVGDAIRDRRKRMGLTLQQVAKRSGLSAPFLSQVERSQAYPSLLSLEAMARALEVNIDYFTRAPSPRQVVARASDQDRIEIESPVIYERLSGRHAERKMEALRLTVPAGLAAPTMRRQGEGFWYILSGRMEVRIGRRVFILETGDSAHFDQRHPYDMRALEQDVRMIWVGTPAIFHD